VTHAEYLALRRFPALDGLRAVAAALVVFFHFGGPHWTWVSGWIGVHIFFVLSGFLITTLALREEARDERVSLRNFYLRRGARILPVYYVVAAVVVALAWARGELAGRLAADLPYYLTFTGELLGPGEPWGQVWTLGIEQKFYLLWPLLAFAVALSVRRRAAVAVAVLAVVLTLCPINGMFVSYVPIAAGCLLAVVLHCPRGFAALAGLTRPVGAVVAAAVFALAHLAVPTLTAALGEPGAILVYTPAVVALLVSLVGGRGPVAWLLSRRPLVFTGDRSYSVYLIQSVAATVVGATIPALGTHRTATAVAVLAVAVAMADLLYRWVELPGIVWGRRATRARRIAAAS
jgi:peptidoglycan/LPS O-acetylase OafA/YrhL